MSGIFGVLQRSGKPVAEHLICDLLSTMSHRGPDDHGIWTNNNVGFGHCMLHTTPESLNEAQPYTSSCGNLTITADARIDNRNDLFNQLEINTLERKIFSDSQLILLAYNRWGNAGFSKLIGDFAFAIWDNRARKLICVRDYLGVKPLYYHCSKDLFIFSSEIKPIIIAVPSLKEQINEAMVIEHLSFCLCSQEETLFKNINNVQSGCFQTVTNEHSTSERYYFFNRQLIVYKNDRDYAEHFLELFSQVVSRMLRSNTTVGFELSGGLDSSSICGMASFNRKNNPTPKLLAYAQIFPGLNCDESNYIQSVLDKWDIEARLTTQSSLTHQPDYFQFVQNTYTLPEPPNLSLFSPLRESAKADGTRVMLSGNGGDQWFQGSNFVYLDILKTFNFPLLYSELFSTPYTSFRQNLRYLTINLIWPIIPNFYRRRIRRLRYRNGFPPWLQESFIAKTLLLQRLEQSDAAINYPDLAFSQVFRLLQNGMENYFLGLLNQNSAHYSFEYRFPFFDRQLVEFALCLPEHQRVRRQQTKHILRQTGNNILPELVRNRQDKADFSYVFSNILHNQLFSSTINRIAESRNSWVKGTKLLKHFTESVGSDTQKRDDFPKYIWEMWFAFAIEIWYEICMDDRKKEH